MVFCYNKELFVKLTFQFDLSLSYPAQVILSSMIKECEIKVENRGMADAQGWEHLIHTATSEIIWKILVIIAWEAVTATSDGLKVVVKNLEGE